MAWFETWFKNDLAKPINVVQLQGVMFNLDNLANKIGVELEYNGQPAALEGTIAGYVIRNDGTTLNLTTNTGNTGKDGNKAWVILPQEAYTVEGPISIVIKLVYNSAETTIGACAGYVTRSRTSSEIAPTGTVIPSLASLEAAIAAANTAAANAADATDYIAPTEEERTASAAHAVGSYFIYNGKLMNTTSAIAQGATIVPYASGVTNYNCAEVPNGLSGSVYNVNNMANAASNNAADAQRLVAPVESFAGVPTSVATMPHATGSYFVYGGALYEATADIAIGDSIVPSGANANCEAVPGGIGGEVSGLESAIDGINNTLTKENDSSDYWILNSWRITDGSYLGNNKRIRTKENIITPAGLDYIVSSDPGVVFYVVFYTAIGTYVPRDAYPFVSYADIKAIAPEGAEVFRLVAKTDPESTLTDVVAETGEKVHISHGVIGEIDSRINALETVEDDLVEFTNVTGYTTVYGVMLNDGTINESSTLPIKKYPYNGGDVYLNGTASYNTGNNFCYVWYVANEAMMENGYILVSSKPQTFDMQKLDVPAGTEEIWVGSAALALYESSAIDRYARGKISVIEEQMSGAVSVGSQWQGKTWYAYGTSITANNGHDGRITYVSYLAQMSGMTAVNKGIGGGGIGNLGAFSTGQVYSAICKTTDGKLNADLITLETGVNDINAAGDIPLGTIYDTGTETLSGCLNDCIRYLQTNTTAQIVVMPSPVSIAQNITEASHQYYTWAAMVEEICRLNRVHFIRSDNNMGYAKLTASDASAYIRDNIHQTELGAYIMAQNIWYQLRNVPLFYTEMPT